MCPCYTPDNAYGSSSYEKTVYVDNPEQQKKINELIDQIKWHEAALCAIITELEKLGIADKVIAQASKSGLIDLVGFYAAHSKEDEARLLKELDKFSEHEQDVLRKLLSITTPKF